MSYKIFSSQTCTDASSSPQGLDEIWNEEESGSNNSEIEDDPANSGDTDTDCDEPANNNDTDIESNDSYHTNADESVDRIPNEFLAPLYQTATISVCASYCTIKEFASSAHLPYATIEKTAAVVATVMPSW